MARYIDADILTERIEYYYSHTGDQRTNAEHYAYGVALKEIDKQPTADVVEVVRCKDCGVKGAAFCMAGDVPLTETTGECFCSYGERVKNNG